VSQLGRAFVAVVPPEHVLDAIEARVAPLRAAHGELRWSRREQWHLTLRFLGPVPDADAVVRALVEELASVPRPGGVHLVGAGAFPTASRASVVWLGIRDGADALTRLAEAVEWASVAAGFAPDARDFTPHLTVARAPRRRDVVAVVTALGDDPVGPPWPVDDVVLVASDTRPSGAVYSEIARVPLARMVE
jgi:2'-5' RNA ligase